MNQLQTRAKILIGSPKKNAACRSFSNMTGGISPGVVIAYQNTNTATSTNACHSRRVFWLGLRVPHITVTPPVAARPPPAVARVELGAARRASRLVTPPVAARPPPAGARVELGAARRSSLTPPASAVRSLSALRHATRPR